MKYITLSYRDNIEPMKTFYRILSAIVLLIVALAGGIYFYLKSTAPRYSGEVSLKGLEKETEVIFDQFGIPHIYAQSETDAYKALGYVHAQERLFQMEMIRRLAAGELSEILGKDLVKTDRFFRTLGLKTYAEDWTAANFNTIDKPYKKAALAYLEGVNEFIKNGPTPPEYILLGIPKRNFSPADMCLIGEYMAFSFAIAIQTDPVVEKVYRQYGMEYLKDWALDYNPGSEKIPVHPVDKKVLEEISTTIAEVFENTPAPPFIGSNGWVIGAEKTESGSVILANDTHMGYGQPGVWYEAHLEAPGFSLYGNHLAGFPFALIGHNREAGWGLTMFENDDLDFFVEQRNPDNKMQVLFKDKWEELKVRKETIKVKDSDDVTFDVHISRHGPIINQAMEAMEGIDEAPVALHWVFLQQHTRTFEAFYQLGHTTTIDQARKAAAMIDGPGLNVMYGDKAGNYAWWAAGKLPIRPEHVQPKRFLDGTGNDEYEGYYDFADNPQNENNPQHYIYSANNQPDSIKGGLYPGYYAPENRAERITDLIKSKEKWTTEALKTVNMDVTSPAYARLAREMMITLRDNPVLTMTENHKKAAKLLMTWDGEHQTEQVSPVIFYKVLSHVMEKGLKDELGEASYQVINASHLMKRTLNVLIPNDSSLWWDNVNTEQKESREKIFALAFAQGIKELEQQLGTDMNQWKWSEAHTVEHVHPVGRMKPFDKVFNVGPFAVRGGHEVINNSGFKLNTSGKYLKKSGPAMRILIDFADVENSESVLPTGQSGHLMSKHYDDQAQLYNEGIFRKQMMNRQEIEQKQQGTLWLKPVSSN